MISPNRIKWNNKTNLQFNCFTFLAFDSDSGEVSSYLNSEAIFTESYNGSKNRVTNYKYSEKLSPQITFIKDSFEQFTQAENREMLSWLTSKKVPSWLTVYSSPLDIAYEILGNFTDIQIRKSGNGRILGYVCTFESIYPYAMSQIKTTTSSSGQFTIQCGTDEYEAAIYPSVEVTVGGNVDFRVTNSTTNTKVRVEHNSTNEKITLDGTNKTISTTKDNRVIGDDFNWTWAPLTYGKNIIGVALYDSYRVQSTYVPNVQYYELSENIYVLVSITSQAEFDSHVGTLYIANDWTVQSTASFNIKFSWREAMKVGDLA